VERTPDSYLSLGYPLQAAVGGTVNAILQCVIAFGIHVTPPQNAAVTAVANWLMILIAVAVATVANSTRYRRRPIVPPPAV
jgi:hypothetical protein